MRGQRRSRLTSIKLTLSQCLHVVDYIATLRPPDPEPVFAVSFTKGHKPYLLHCTTRPPHLIGSTIGLFKIHLSLTVLF